MTSQATRRTFDDAINTNARVQIDEGRGVYHLYFAIGTESYKFSKMLTSGQMEKILYLERYTKTDEQDCGRIKTFSK